MRNSFCRMVRSMAAKRVRRQCHVALFANNRRTMIERCGCKQNRQISVPSAITFPFCSVFRRRGETEIVRFTDALPFLATRTDDGRNGRKPGEAGLMIRLFKHYIPNAVFLLGLFDFLLLIVGRTGLDRPCATDRLDFGPINERWRRWRRSPCWCRWR
jgi:hypothetical protein